MRNILQFPVTKEEVLAYLVDLREKECKDIAPGNMAVTLLNTVIKVIEKHGIELTVE